MILITLDGTEDTNFWFFSKQKQKIVVSKDFLQLDK